MFKHTILIGSIALLLISAASLGACGSRAASAANGVAAEPFHGLVPRIAYPAPQPPLDETRITPVETAGAAATK